MASSKFANYLRFFLFTTPIFFGGLIYIFWGAKNLLVNQVLLDYLGATFVSFRHNTLIYRVFIPDFILYNLPDFCWVFSYTLIMIEIWRRESNFEGLIWVSLGFILAAAGEIGQFLNFVPGTFDKLDLLAFVLGLTIPIFLHKRSLF